MNAKNYTQFSILVMASLVFGIGAIVLSFLCGKSHDPRNAIAIIPALVLVLLCMIFAQMSGELKIGKP